MKTLFILRHAKSSWEDDLASDHDRQLNERGKRNAAAMNIFMSKHGLSPQTVLCSTARRTVDTLAYFVSTIGDDVPVFYDEGLYLASAPSMLERIQMVDDAAESVLLVAHNPGIEELACDLAKTGSSSDLVRIQTKYPTGALALLEFDVATWKEVDIGKGRLVSFTCPRDL